MELSVIWYVLICVLFIGYLVLDGFDLGVGIWHLFAKNEEERRVHMASIGPVWDGNEVWLITAGGALFAAFPPVYATAFSGLYTALTLLLIGLIFRAVSLEFRSKVASQCWRRVWDYGFGIGSLVVALLLGVAFGNILRGLPLLAEGRFDGGIFTLLNPFSLLFGVCGIVLLSLHSGTYLLIKTEGALYDRVKARLPMLWCVFLALLVLVALYGVWDLSALYENLGNRFLTVVFAALLIAGIVFVKLSLGSEKNARAFLSTSTIIVSLFSLGATGLFPALLRSSIDPRFSLTAYNSSSTPLTLKTMLIITLICLPFVLGYTIYIYRVFRGKVRGVQGY